MSNMNKVLGFERINERVKRPNALINFIKPLEGPDKVLSQDFLERVAAICYPIMKANHIVVMALEEFPPNMEFVGRNFNAGEVVQLVLKSPHTKQWLPFKHVQMVMMHELAHCKQMNHSRAFWKVRNGYADELKTLWSKDYSGEGLWGRGQSLISGRYMTNHMPEAADAPASLCGGTFRSSGGRKRKRKEDKPKLTYAERQQRRIAKKFGVNGVTLGDDEGVRAKLESGQKGKKPVGKPRVAGSNRGRELRAAAALARLDDVKKEAVKEGIDWFKKEPMSDDDFETDSDDDSYPLAERSFNPEDGNMVRVCENEDPKDNDAQREFDELREIDRVPPRAQDKRPSKPEARTDLPSISVTPEDASTASEGEAQNSKSDGRKGGIDKPVVLNSDDGSTESEDDSKAPPTSKGKSNLHEAPAQQIASQTSTKPGRQLVTIPIQDDASTESEDEKKDNVPTTRDQKAAEQSELSATPFLLDNRDKNDVPEPAGTPQLTAKSNPSRSSTQPQPSSIPASNCPICSLENEVGVAICAACSHVLDRRLMPNSWQCQSSNCHGTGYVNPGDYNLCGICGSRKP